MVITLTAFALEDASSQKPMPRPFGGDSEGVHFELKPSYSDSEGVGLRGAVGGYLADGLALGVVLDFSKDRRAQTANLGIDLTDTASFVGSTPGNAHPINVQTRRTDVRREALCSASGRRDHASRRQAALAMLLT